MDRLNEETNQKVKRLTALLSQRAHLDAEISKLREEINALIVDPERVDSSEQSIATSSDTATSSAVITPPPYKPSTPPPYNPNPNPPVQSVNPHTDEERNIGVRWMAVAGVSIAVLGLIICIKIMLDRGLIGPVGRVVIGYLVSAGVVAAAILKVPEKRHVLKDMLVFGGSFLAYGDTCLAYGYFDLFPSSVTIVVLWCIAIGLIAYAWVRDNKLLFNVAIFTFVMSPFLAGYAMDREVNKTIFWMSFAVIFNALMFVVYKIKKWSSPLVTAFFATFMIFAIKMLDGATMTHGVAVSFFTLCCMMFYAASVLLHRLKENFNGQFISFNICNFLLYIICILVTLSYKTPISHSFLAMSLTLFVAAFLMRKFLTDANFCYNATYSFSIFFLNLAFLVGFTPRGAQWFPIVYGVEILAMLLVYKATALEYYKRLCVAMVYVSFAVILCYLVWVEGNNINLIVLNIPCIAKMVYAAVLVYVLSQMADNHNKTISIILFATLFMIVAIEIYRYWNYIDVAYDNDLIDTTHAISIRQYLAGIMIMWWFLVLSFLYSIAPEKVDFLSACSKIGHISILVGIAVFSVVAHYWLAEIRTEYFTVNYAAWRYVSLALLLAASVYAVRSRNCMFCSNWDVITDIVVSCVGIVAVSSEINNIVALISDEDNSYGLWLSAWFGVASLILFLVGFRCQLKHLRILGFVVAGVTVFKIIFYDMWNHQLWVKAVVFVAVGICFILVSYFYTKHLKK